MTSDQPSVVELWRRAESVGGTKDERQRRYRDLMVEHGYIIEGKQEPLPCGWMPGRHYPESGQ